MEIIDVVKDGAPHVLIYGVVSGDLVRRKGEIYRVLDSDCADKFIDALGVNIELATPMMCVPENEIENISLIELNDDILKFIGAKKTKDYWTLDLDNGKQIYFNSDFDVSYLNRLSGKTYRAIDHGKYLHGLQKHFRFVSGSDMDINIDELQKIIQ